MVISSFTRLRRPTTICNEEGEKAVDRGGGLWLAIRYFSSNPEFQYSPKGCETLSWLVGGVGVGVFMLYGLIYVQFGHRT